MVYIFLLGQISRYQLLNRVGAREVPELVRASSSAPLENQMEGTACAKAQRSETAGDQVALVPKAVS